MAKVTKLKKGSPVKGSKKGVKGKVESDSTLQPPSPKKGNPVKRSNNKLKGKVKSSTLQQPPSPEKVEGCELKSVEKTIKKRTRKKKGKKSNILKGTDLLAELLTEVGTGRSEVDPLQGFKVIKWKLNDKSETVHHLFIKKHTVPIAEMTKEKPPGRTILCHNVPSYLSDNHLMELFRPFGNIGNIFVHQKPTLSVGNRYDHMFPSEKETIRGYKVAYVVFTDTKHVNDIMEINSDELEPVVLKNKPLSGIQKWTHIHNKQIYSTSALETSVRTFMENFDKEELKRKAMEKNGGEPDEDGWVTVTRTGKRAASGLVRSEAMEERLRAKKRRQDKQLFNITPAQVKESKMKQLVELKKKFEEDKQRVTLLKQQRKFKPF